MWKEEVIEERVSEKREEEWLWWSESGGSSVGSGQRDIEKRKGKAR